MGLYFSLRGWIACCLSLGAIVPLLAQQPTLEDYRHLQEVVGRQEARLRQLETDRLPPIDSGVNYYDVATNASVESRLAELEAALYADGEASKGKHNSDKPTFKMGGRIHFDYWGFPAHSSGISDFEHPPTVPPAAINGTDVEDRFAFRRIRLEMRGDILDTMLYKIDLDFNNPGTPEYKDVYLGWKALPYNQELLLGNQKRPLGLDHLNSSRYNVFMERPLVIEAFNEDARRIGLAMYGYTDDELYHWRYGVYNLENTSTDGRSIGDSLQLSGNFRLSSSPWYDDSSGGRGYFHWAVSGMYARPDGDRTAADTNLNEGRFRTRMEARSDSRWIDTRPIAGITDYEIVGLEAMLNVGRFQVVSEFQSNWAQRDTAADLHFHGAYVYVSYFLTGEHQPYNRKTGCIDRVEPFENFFLVDRCCGGRGWGLGAWQIAARYSYLDISDENVLGGVGKNFTAGLNWFWTPYSKVQLNYIYGDISDHAPVNGSTAGNYHMIGTRFMIDF
ncbi:MAG TPA: porin [Pirellulaceae bacterium]|nr:porin [Pirellulaceae bacterium]